ncbi:MAG: DUF6755 family protein [Hyphomicrobiales bacterium]
MTTPNNGRGPATEAPLASPLDMPGRQALLLGALLLGLLMMGIQLWLLTVALELYLGGNGDDIWGLAIASGVVFAGGLVAIWLLSRRPRIAGRR